MSIEDKFQISNITGSTAAEKSHIISADPAILLGFTAMNFDGYACYVHVYDAATVPTNGAIPKTFLFVPSMTQQSFNSNSWNGIKLDTGLVLVASSTGPTLTLITTDTVWLTVGWLKQ